MERLTAEDRLMLWPDERWPQDIGALAVLDGAGRPDLPAELDRLVLQLLAKNPKSRPDDAGSVAATLTLLRGRGSPSRPALQRCPVM